MFWTVSNVGIYHGAFLILQGFVQVQAFALLGLGKGGRVRMSPHLALTINALGSVGWTIGTIVGAIIWLGVNLTYTLTDVWTSEILNLLPLVPLALGGLLAVSFAILGLRRCKFANTQRPDKTESSEKPVARAQGS